MQNIGGAAVAAATAAATAAADAVSDVGGGGGGGDGGGGKLVIGLPCDPRLRHNMTAGP